MTFSALLLPELEAEIAKTRAMLERVPEDNQDFKPHERSMVLSRLAGHTAEVLGFAGVILTTPGVDMGTPSDPRRIIKTTDKAERNAIFEEVAAASVEALKNATDETLHGDWTMSRQGQLMRTMTRYAAYRNNSLNHMIHHRAQLGVYLRLLEVAVPATYGPSADEK